MDKDGGNDVRVDGRSMVMLSSDAALVTNLGKMPVEMLLLQGRPIGEPIAKEGPFVMTTPAELRVARDDFGQTRFGGWPWNEDVVVFPVDVGRFVLKDGVKSYPSSSLPSSSTSQ